MKKPAAKEGITKEINRAAGREITGKVITNNRVRVTVSQITGKEETGHNKVVAISKAVGRNNKEVVSQIVEGKTSKGLINRTGNKDHHKTVGPKTRLADGQVSKVKILIIAEKKNNEQIKVTSGFIA